MTVTEAGKQDGLLMEVTAEEGVETDSPVILFAEKEGKINSDLTVGVDLAAALSLTASDGLAHKGVQLNGMGFVLSEIDLPLLLSKEPNGDALIKEFINGRDLVQKPRQVKVIDTYGYDADELRLRFPYIYQLLLTRVKPERDENRRDVRRLKWWRYGEPAPRMREGIEALDRYVATTRTAKHRIFSFVSSTVISESKVIVICLSDGYSLGVLSSQVHRMFSYATGGWLGVGNDHTYNHTECFDPFPFPDATEAQKQTIGAIAEELDAHRKRVLESHEHLTLTGLYNVLERLKAGVRPDDLDAKERRIFDDGLVLIIRELHERLDAAVAQAYGWPVDLPEEEVLSRLVALNKERADEEKRGLVRWLRPDYQIPRFGSEKEKAKQLEADFGIAAQPAEKAGPKPAFPPDDIAQTGLVMNALISSGAALDAGTIASSFKQGRKVMPAVSSVLVSLYRMGLISTADGGKTFAYRRAA